VSPPWLGRRICKNAFAKSRQTADGVLTNAGADAVAEPRGAYAPRSCSRMCVRPSQNSLFQRRANDVHQERRVSARRGVGIALAKTIPHTFADDRLAQALERRLSAPRVCGKRTCKDD